MATQGSEYGGVPGKIAPLPHELSSYELARLERAIDPTDAVTSAEDQRLIEARRERRGSINNPDGFDGGPQ